MKFRSLVSQIGKPVSVSEALVNRSTKWISEHFGVSVRTAQKWKSGKGKKMPDGTYRPQAPGKEVGGSEGVMKSADADTRRTVAANAMRNAQAVHVGRVQVEDKSPRGKGPRPGKNFRNIGTVQLSERSREQMGQAADALERGDTQRAEQLMNEAIMRSYGSGAESALSVADWSPGFHLI